MKASHKILFNTVVRTYYKQHIWLFIFLYLVFFGVVAPSQQAAYHYALIRGALETRTAFVIMLCIWLLYALKCAHWIRKTMRKPEMQWLRTVFCLGNKPVWKAMLLLQIFLYLPVGIYAAGVAAVALYTGKYIMSVIVITDIAVSLLGGATAYQYLVSHPFDRKY